MAGANIGHGHVYPRADGVVARCGGPALCSDCAKDAARQASGPLADRLDSYAAHFEYVGKRNMDSAYMEIVEKGKLDLKWALDFREAARVVREANS